ncbi:MAG: hypothetical protein JWM99_1972, partial [Verrucomicrobiales bacterium]|nr:hypothetical protein [Verrucomicrobiales bacterium]
MVSQRWSFSRGVRGFVVAASLLLCIGGCKQPSVKSKSEIRSIHMAGVYAEAARTLAAEFE